MRYQFSTFPGQWPGLGLLLLRLAQAVWSIQDMRLHLRGSGEAVALATLCAQWLTSGLLGVGLLTPAAGLLLAVLESCRMVIERSIDTCPAMLTVMGVSLAMLGPGAWSIDARLFGRRRINL